MWIFKNRGLHMNLNFLGNGSAFCPERKNTSAYFWLDERLIVLDCGETVFESLYERGLFKGAPEIYIFLTHFHADHVGSLPTLLSYYACLLHKSVNIITPERATLVQLLDLTGIDHSYYTIHDPNELGWADLKATYIPVQHAEDIPCYGFLLETGDDAIYYSGDAADLPDDVLEAFLQGKVSRLYHDTCSAPNDHHCYVGKMAECIPESERSRVYCMHLDSVDSSLYTRYGFRIAEP